MTLWTWRSLPLPSRPGLTFSPRATSQANGNIQCQRASGTLPPQRQRWHGTRFWEGVSEKLSVRARGGPGWENHVEFAVWWSPLPHPPRRAGQLSFGRTFCNFLIMWRSGSRGDLSRALGGLNSNERVIFTRLETEADRRTMNLFAWILNFFLCWTSVDAQVRKHYACARSF